MKSLMLIASIVLTCMASGQSPAQTHTGTQAGSKAHILSVSELDNALVDPRKVLIIDVRRPDEVSSIGGFPVYLSIQIQELGQSLEWIPKDRSIITVSNHAARAGKAADLLAGKGFKVIGAVGTQTYEQAGGKRVTHIAVPPAVAAGQ